MVTLATAIDAILDGMIAELTAANVTGGTLADVVLIARGDRAEPRPDVPAVYVTPEKMRIADREGFRQNLTEWWEMPVTVSAVCQHVTPATGYTNASDLASRARNVLLTQNSSNFDLAYVKGVTSDTFDPAGPWSRNADYYRASAGVVILFTVRG